MRPVLYRAVLPLVALLAVPGCGSDGARFVSEDQTLLFEGIILSEDASQQHDFALSEAGLVQFFLDRLIATDPETGDNIENGTVAISIGRPIEVEGEQGCQASFSAVVTEEQNAQFYLQADPYCILVFRSAGLTTDAIVEYTITARTRQSG